MNRLLLLPLLSVVSLFALACGPEIPGEEGEGEGAQPGGEGEGMPQEKVEIPGVDSTGRPEAFREELLKAMKDETPEHYRERVRDYYEELVK